MITTILSIATAFMLQVFEPVQTDSYVSESNTIEIFSSGDRYAYVSNVKHYKNYTVVTVSATSDALAKYPNGFMVGVRPANHIFNLYLLTSRNEKVVRIAKDNPSVDVIFYCDEDYTGKKACSQEDFVVNSKL